MATEQTTLPIECTLKIGSDLQKRRLHRRVSLGVMAVALILLAILSAGVGPVQVTPSQVIGILAHKAGIALPVAFDAQQETVITAIRLPRILLAMVAGAALATAGAALQGLFRNPLADPGLIGVSLGSVLGAVSMIVLGKTVLAPVPSLLGAYALPCAAFFTGLAVTFIVFRISTTDGRTNVATMLLAGIAMNALVAAVVGSLTYVSTDDQLRSLTFWSMGSLGGASWKPLLASVPFALVATFLLARQSRVLDAIALGEAPASYLGFNVQRSRRAIIVFSSLAVGSTVAVVGGIGFVGLVVPHVVRMLVGPNHRGVLPASALLGAILLLGADLLARNVLAPAEIPVGIVTAAFGAPFFLWLLLSERRGYV